MKNWKSALVSPSDTIRKVIRTIDTHGMQIALVVDAKRRLLGSVTDGDVRRGILKGVSLDERIVKVMQAAPITAGSDSSKESVLALMKQKRVHQIPLLDKDGRVVGVEVVDELVRAGGRENWVVLMAGGLGSRLRPLTDHQPKPLLNVGQRPILETILRNLVQQGFRHFYLSVNYKNKMVRDYFGDGSPWGVEIRYLDESKKLGTAGALSLLPARPKEPLLVMNGDILTNINFNQLLRFHGENRVSATMSVREYDFQVPYGVVKMRNNRIAGIDEKPIHRFFVNAGIYVIEPLVLKYVRKNKRVDMTQVFERLIQDGRAVGAFPIREYWLDIGRLDDLEKANGDFSKVFDPEPQQS